MNNAMRPAGPGVSPAEPVQIAWGAAAVNWGGLIAWSLLRVPIPAVNEPHYLGKAKHFWDPTWCTGDLFLDSSNPHQFFYVVFGWLTLFCSLETAALIGRIGGLAVVALGWQRLTQTLTGERWAGLLALPVFLTLQSLGNWSGEWLVGGIEAKVPAYGLLFWALGSWLSGATLPAAIAAGLAVSFHPLVGLWGVIAAVLAQSMSMIWMPADSETWGRISLDRKTILRTLLAGLLLVLTALPGLIPAVDSLRSDDPQAERIATQLQVGDRLSHHLDPMRFPKPAYGEYALLIVIWLLLERGTAASARRRWWRAFVVATLLIAGAGILIGWGPRPVTQMPGFTWRLWMLKFYPFRLADLILPVAVSISAASLWLSALEHDRSRRASILRWAAVGTVVLGAAKIPFADQNPSRLSASARTAWIDLCTWIREETDPHDLVYAADSGWAVKWYAQRPEYVNYKDVPQDAAGMMEWNRRLWVIADWRLAAMADGQVSVQELQDLHRQTGIRWLICGRFGPVNRAPAMSTADFRVYALPGE